MTRLIRAAAVAALCAGPAAAATFDFSEAGIGNEFSNNRGGPVLGPDGRGVFGSDQGTFGADDVVNIIGLSVNRDRDTVTFTFASPFSVAATDLGVLGTLSFVQLFETGGGSVARQNGVTATGPLFGGSVFDAGTYDLRMNNNADTNTVYQITLTGVSSVPLPAPALMLLAGLGSLAVLRRRA